MSDWFRRIAKPPQESPPLCAIQTPPLKASSSKNSHYANIWYRRRVYDADFHIRPQDCISLTVSNDTPPTPFHLTRLWEWFGSHPRLLFFLCAIFCLWSTKLTFTVKLAEFFLHVYEIPRWIEQASTEHHVYAESLGNISECLRTKARSLEDKMLDKILIDASKAIDTLERNQPKLVAAEVEISQCLKALTGLAIPQETQNVSICSTQLANGLFRAVESDDNAAIHLEKLILKGKLSRMTQFVASQISQLKNLTRPNALPIASRITETLAEVVGTIATDVKSLEASITQWMLKYGNLTNASIRQLQVLHLASSNAIRIDPIQSKMISETKTLQKPLKKLWNTTWQYISSPARIILQDSMSTIHQIQDKLLEDVYVIDESVKVSKLKLLYETRAFSNEWNKFVNNWMSGWEELTHQIKSLSSALSDRTHRHTQSGSMPKHSLVKRLARRQPPTKVAVDTRGSDANDWFSTTLDWMHHIRLSLLTSKGNPNSQMKLLYSYLNMFDTAGNIYLILAVGVKLYCGIYTPMTTLDVRDMSKFSEESNLSRRLPCRHKFARYCYKLIVYVPIYLKAVIKRAGYLLLLVLITALLYSWKVSWYEGCVRSSESKVRWADFLQDSWASSMFGTIGSVSKQLEESEDAVVTFYLRTCRNLQRYELEPFAENQNARREAVLDQQKKSLELVNAFEACVDTLEPLSNTNFSTCEPKFLQLDVLNQNWCQPISHQQITQTFKSCSNLTIRDVERQYVCTLERVVYLTMASYWFTFSVMITARFVAHTLLRIFGLCWWEDLNDGRIQCLAFCNRDGSLDNVNFVMKRIRGHLKRVYFEIRLRLMLLLFAVLIACYNTFLLFSTL
ncbi:unnamed protein product [Albugo candida]|uniref:Uncharacterized protein n=1 Tax=Albugo candida TaxID=65357 RepID=A0A024G4R9_9STRA|nr:unnamed protein product [Albugo candida]|eukprot:CCI41299.1 unnamed protein product [Albugo candida]